MCFNLQFTQFSDDQIINENDINDMEKSSIVNGEQLVDTKYRCM